MNETPRILLLTLAMVLLILIGVLAFRDIKARLAAAILEQEQAIAFGAFRPSGYVGKLLTRLQEGGSEGTFNTTPCTTPDGQTITSGAIGDFIVITINPGAGNEEKISASSVSCSGTTLTWTVVNRGLSFASPTTTVTANKEQHAIGETVIISNDDQFLTTQYIDFDSNQTIAGHKTFTLGALFSTAASSTDECSSNTEYCTKLYIDNSVNQGAATSTETNGGIVELGTALEAASSTDLGANTPLVLQTKNATDTPQSGCATGYASTAGAGCTVIARLTGKIRQSWIDLTEAFTWAGAHIFQSTVTFNDPVTITDTTSISATTTVSANVIGKPFGGTGADGALNITSGTTTVDCASAAVCVKNYTSINISAGAGLAFSNPASGGSVIVLKSQGNVTIAGTLDTQGMGASTGVTGNLVLDDSSHHGGTGGNGAAADVGSAGAAGAIYTNKFLYVTPDAQRLVRKTYTVAPGSGGGNGGTGFTSAGVGGTGGTGGGALIVEVGGTLSFSGVINTSGADGTAGAGGTTITGSGGGGGGCAGMGLVLYNFVTTNSGTKAAWGGGGGAGGSSTGTQGGANGAGGGGGGCGNYTGAGGAGAAGNATAAGSSGSAGSNGAGSGGASGGASDGGGGKAGGAASARSSSDSNLILITQNLYF